MSQLEDMLYKQTTKEVKAFMEATSNPQVRTLTKGIKKMVGPELYKKNSVALAGLEGTIKNAIATVISPIFEQKVFEEARVKLFGD